MQQVVSTPLTPRPAGIALVALGSLVLVGWALDWEFAKRIVPTAVAMNPATAVAFILSGAALAALTSARRGLHALGQGLGLAVAMLGLLRLIAYAGLPDLQVDQLLFQSRLTEPNLLPNRVAPNAAAGFVAAGLTLLLIPITTVGTRRTRQTLALLVGLLSLLTIYGYLYRVTPLYELPLYIPMALHTGIGFLVLSAGLLASDPKTGFMGLILSNSAGGWLARRLLPAAVVVPALIGWLRLWGEKAGLYQTQMGLSLNVVANTIVFLTLVWWTAKVLHRIDAQRRRAEEESAAARQAAEQANRAKSAFLANMSHEIRTPMTAILGYTDLLLNPQQTPSDRFEHVNTIRRNTEHLLVVINDILDISKVEAGEMKVERTLCSPCQLVCGVASMMRVRAGERKLSLEIQVEGRIPRMIRCDPTRLRQVLINLVGNAIKFTESGRVRVVMKMDETVQDRPPRLRFEIIDSGVGMTKEQVERLFRPFSQADESTTRRYGGTGLGLSICKRLVEMLGGTIEVESTPGIGSRFGFSVETGPLEGVEMVTQCREAAAGVAAALLPDLRVQLRGRVLLADDGEDNQRLLGYYLGEAGLEVTSAANGREACEQALGAMAADRPFDLILMDMQMPELDGYGAAARLRGKGYSGPIIAITAHAMAEDRQKCLRAGCSDYLSKPLTRAQLLETVSRNLGQQTALPDAGPVARSTPVRPSELRDPAVQPFVEEYLAKLPGLVNRLTQALIERDLDDISTVLHNLKGTGALFGLPAVSETAMRAENSVQVGEPHEVVAERIKELVDLLRRLEGYNPELESAAPSVAT